MIIRLPEKQLDAVLKALDGHWLRDWVEEEGQIDATGKKLEVLLLPDAWREILDVVIARYATAGGSRRGSPPLWDAVRKIARAVNERATHPAFRNMAVAGRQYEVIPAWVPFGERNVRTHWSPWISAQYEIGTPNTTHELIYLWPEHDMDGGQMISAWQPAAFGTPATSWMSPSYEDYERFIKARSEA